MLTLWVAGTACSGAKTEPAVEASPDGEGAATVPTEVKATDEAPGEPTKDAPATAPEAEASPMARLARDMMKTGRKIGWSTTKRSIAYGEIWFEGPGRGLRVVFRGEDGKTDAHEVCKPGECEEALDEKLVTEVPKVASKLEAGGYQAISGNGWAMDQPEFVLMSAEMKLSYVKGKLGIVGEKSTKALGNGPSKASPVAVFIVKDDKVLIVDFQMDDAKPGTGPTVAHELKLFKLP